MNEKEARDLVLREAELAARQVRVMHLIFAERDAAEMKFPDQHLPQGTGPDVYPMDIYHDVDPTLSNASADVVAFFLKKRCQESGSAKNPDTWAKVIGEEYGEYIESADPQHTKAELVQLGAMVLRALEDILAAEDAAERATLAKLEAEVTDAAEG